MATDSRTLPDLPNKPGTNWIEKAGGYPGGKRSLHKRIVKHLVAKGMPESRAYATAVSQIRKVCATGRTFGGQVAVSAKVKAEYCAAAAGFEGLRAKNAAKKAVEAPRERVRVATPNELGWIAQGARLAIEAAYDAGREPDLHDAVILAGCVGDAAMLPLLEAPGFDEGKHRRGRDGKFANRVGRALKDHGPEAQERAIRKRTKAKAKVAGSAANGSAAIEATSPPRLRDRSGSSRASNASGDAKYDESKHKRDRSGKWARKGAGMGAGESPDDRTRRLQHGLRKAGYTVNADGRFGGKTEKALKAFQSDAGITADGVWGPETNSALFGKGTKGAKRDAKKSGGSTGSTSGGTKKGGKSEAERARAATKRLSSDLSPGAGMSGDPDGGVRDLQRQLLAAGIDVGSPGVDGRFGNLTAQAVRQFQREKGLTVDGLVGPETRDALAQAARERVGGGITFPSDDRAARRAARKTPKKRTAARRGAAIEATDAPSFAAAVGQLDPGERALLPDGVSVQAEHTRDGRLVWRVFDLGLGRDDAYGERYGDSYADADGAASGALSRSAAMTRPQSVGGTTRWGSYRRVKVNGREARFLRVNADALPVVKFPDDTPTPETSEGSVVGWADLAVSDSTY